MTWAVGSARGLLGLYGPYEKKTDRLAEKMASTWELSLSTGRSEKNCHRNVPRAEVGYATLKRSGRRAVIAWRAVSESSSEKMLRSSGCRQMPAGHRADQRGTTARRGGQPRAL